MDRFSALLYRAVCGRSPATEAKATDPTTPGGFGAIRARAESLYGSGPKAARSLGIPPETWRRWGLPAGHHLRQTPGAVNRARLSGWATAVERRARLSPGRERRLRGVDTVKLGLPGKGVRLKVVERYMAKNQTTPRRRTIVLDGRHLRPGAVGRIVDAFLAGTTDLRSVLIHQITDHFYRELLTSTRTDFGVDIEDVSIS